MTDSVELRSASHGSAAPNGESAKVTDRPETCPALGAHPALSPLGETSTRRIESNTGRFLAKGSSWANGLLEEAVSGVMSHG
jgi:hypothetical protein